jgi:hypothetical protein
MKASLRRRAAGGRTGECERARRWIGVLAVLAGSGLTGGCFAAHATLLHGTADAAAVMSGGDVAAATRIAQHHCATYARNAQYQLTDEGVAYFKCLKP